MSLSIAELTGGEGTADEPYGEDMSGGLVNGYIPDRSLVFQPLTQLGDGLAGPPNDQQLQIYRDNRPLAVDELGMQGPFRGPKLAKHRAGRAFPMNEDWGPNGLDTVPLRGLDVQMDTLAYAPPDPAVVDAGFAAPEIIPGVGTVYYTASPDVGWEGY